MTKRRSIMRYAAIIAALGLLFVFLGEFWPVGPDYYFSFRWPTEAFFKGATRLYDWGISCQFYNAPWAVFLLAPTLLLPPRYGQAVLTLLSLTGLLFAIHAVNGGSGGKSRLYMVSILLAMANLHTVDLVERGNIDSFLLYGLGLAWLGVKRRKPLWCGIGLLLLSVKPMNVFLASIVIIWAARDWSRREKILVVAPVGIVSLLSFPVFGFDWPIRYVQYAKTYPIYTFLQISLWRMFEFFGLKHQIAYWLAVPAFIAAIWVILTKGSNRWVLAFALTVNMAFSPYMMGNHYVLLAPVLVMLATYRKEMLALWFLTLTPLLRLIWGFEIAWVDLAYAWALMVGVLLVWKCGPGIFLEDDERGAALLQVGVK